MKALFLVFICLIFSTPSFAWVISKKKGKISLTRQGKAIKWQINKELPDNVTIQTGKRAKAILKDGNKKVFIGKKSILRLSEIKESNISLIEVVHGLLRAKVKKMPKATILNVKTPSAVAGVRGTEFFVHHDKKEQFCTIKGEISVSFAKTGKSVSIPAKHGVLINGDEVGDVTPTPNRIVKKWVDMTSLNVNNEDEDY